MDCPVALNVPAGEAVVDLRLQIKAQLLHADEMVKDLRSPSGDLLRVASTRRWIGPGKHCYVEEWANLAQLEEQIRSRPFGRLLAVMETAPRKPVLEVRSVSEMRGLDYIKTIRLGSGTHGEPASESA